MSNRSADSSGGRSPFRAFARWVLLRVNRWVLTGVILLSVFVVLVLFSQAGLTPLRTIVDNKQSIEFLFAAFIGTIVTGTSIVVTINQLVLSQELGALGDQRERMQKSMGFRRDIEDQIDVEASSTDPAVFLSDIADAIAERADHLTGTIESGHDQRQEVIEYVDELTEDINALQDGLEDAEFGSFDVVWNALNFNYSEKIYTARRLRVEGGDSFSEETKKAFDDTIGLLTLFGPVREHFKTMYFQWELINLSRALLYISVPALAVMGVLIMYIDGDALPGAIFGIDNLVWVTSAGFVVGISPFVVFTVFVLRIATVAKQTLAIGPFILQASEREGVNDE